MKREEHWKQESPMVQLRVILGSIHGNTMNIKDGYSKEVAVDRILIMVKDAQRLAEAIAKGDDKWDPQVHVQNLIAMVKKYRTLSASDEVSCIHILSQINQGKSISYGEMQLGEKSLVQALVEDEFLSIKKGNVVFHEFLSFLRNG